MSKENEREGVETGREGTEKTGTHSKCVVRERTREKGGEGGRKGSQNNILCFLSAADLFILLIHDLGMP